MLVNQLFFQMRLISRVGMSLMQVKSYLEKNILKSEQYKILKLSIFKSMCLGISRLKGDFLVTGNESIDMMILRYYCNKDFSLEICIVEGFTLILVCIDAYG